MKKSADVPVISVLNRGGLKSVFVVTQRLCDDDTVIVLAKSAGLASFIQKLKEHCIWVRTFYKLIRFCWFITIGDMFKIEAVVKHLPSFIDINS